MDQLLNLIDAKFWIETFGAVGILAIIFAETGLMVGFFLPGDSLLFTAGFFTTTATASIAKLPLPLLLVGAPVCAILGAQLGHYIGMKAGPKLFARPDSRLFKREYIEKAEYYFDKFGPAKAVVLARFIPIVRTFLNPLAGTVGMPAGKFLLWNAVGGIIWSDGVILIGHFLGSAIPGIDKYLLPAIFVIVVVSLIPVVREAMKARKAKKSRPRGRHAAGAARTEPEPRMTPDDFR